MPSDPYSPVGPPNIDSLTSSSSRPKITPTHRSNSGILLPPIKPVPKLKSILKKGAH